MPAVVSCSNNARVLSALSPCICSLPYDLLRRYACLGDKSVLGDRAPETASPLPLTQMWCAAKEALTAFRSRIELVLTGLCHV